MYTNVANYLKKIFDWIYFNINLATDEGNSWNEIWHWTNNKAGVAVQSWLWVQFELHDLVAQSVRVSKWNSEIISSNPTQANFLELLQRILQWWGCNDLEL